MEKIRSEASTPSEDSSSRESSQYSTAVESPDSASSSEYLLASSDTPEPSIESSGSESRKESPRRDLAAEIRQQPHVFFRPSSPTSQSKHSSRAASSCGTSSVEISFPSSGSGGSSRATSVDTEPRPDIGLLTDVLEQDPDQPMESTSKDLPQHSCVGKSSEARPLGSDAKQRDLQPGVSVGKSSEARPLGSDARPPTPEPGTRQFEQRPLVVSPKKQPVGKSSEARPLGSDPRPPTPEPGTRQFEQRPLVVSPKKESGAASHSRKRSIEMSCSPKSLDAAVSARLEDLKVKVPRPLNPEIPPNVDIRRGCSANLSYLLDDKSPDQSSPDAHPEKPAGDNPGDVPPGMCLICRHRWCKCDK